MLPALRVVAVLHALSSLCNRSWPACSSPDRTRPSTATPPTPSILVSFVPRHDDPRGPGLAPRPDPARGAHRLRRPCWVAEGVQTGAGFAHLLWLHIPLGVVMMGGLARSRAADHAPLPAAGGTRRENGCGGPRLSRCGGRGMRGLHLSRRSALRLFGGAGTAVVLAPARASCAKPGSDGINAGTLTSKAKLPKPFSVPLPILRALAPDSTDAQGVPLLDDAQAGRGRDPARLPDEDLRLQRDVSGPYLDVRGRARRWSCTRPTSCRCRSPPTCTAA